MRPKFWTIFIFAILILSGCKNIYYVGDTNEETNLYDSNDTNSIVVTKIPAGSKLLVRGKANSYSKIAYKNYHGYVYRTRFTNYHRFNSKKDGNLYGYTTYRPTLNKLLSSSSTSTYISSSNSTKKTVHVKGYYRKNGTYVKPYIRRPPSRKR